jgi:hypothetical protein
MSGARKHTPRGGSSDAIVPDVYALPAPPDENTVQMLTAGMIAVLAVVMRMVSGTAPAQAVCMTCMCLLFKEGIAGRVPLRLAVSGVLILAGAAVCVPQDLKYYMGLDFNKKRDEACAVAHKLANLYLKMIDAEERKKMSFASLFGAVYSPLNATHFGFSAGVL